MNLENIKNKMLKENTIQVISEIFKVLGDNTRIKILNSIEDCELCVSDICECVNMSKSAVSHQLRILKQAKLVKYRKSGKEVYYSLDDDHVTQIVSCAKEHVSE